MFRRSLVLFLAISVLGLQPTSGAHAVSIDNFLRACLEKRIGKAATLKIVRAKKLSKAQQGHFTFCSGPGGASGSAGGSSNSGSGSSKPGSSGSSNVVLGSPCSPENSTASISDGTAVCVKNADGSTEWKRQGGGGSGSSGGTGGNAPWYFMSNWDIQDATPRSPKCPSSTPFTVLPVEPSRLDSISPIGYSQPGSHNLPVPHLYFNAPVSSSVDAKGIARGTAVFDVKAPSDLTLMGIVRLTYSKQSTTGGSATYIEYMMSFHVCDTTYVTFNHIADVPASILTEATKGQSRECSTGQDGAGGCSWYPISVAVKAGTTIGQSSGYAHGFDIGSADASKPMTNRLDPGKNSPRWATGTCALDLWPSAMREQLVNKLSGTRECGRADWDIANSLSGEWLAIGQRALAQTEDLHIALFPQNTYDGRLRFSIGTRANVSGLPSGVYVFTPQSSGLFNPAFTAVKPGEVACFEVGPHMSGMSLPVTRIYASMQTTGALETISIAGAGTGSCGAGPYTMPSSVTQFERRTTRSG